MTRKKTDSVMDDPSAFRQQVRIAAVQVTGLRPDELAAALAYEVEPLSGIPAAEAELDYTPVVDADPTVRVYDVAVRRRKGRAGTGGSRFLLPLVILGILVLLVAGADFVRTSARLRALKKDVAAQGALQAQLDAVRSYAEILDTIASACGERAVLTSLGGDAFAIRLSGVAVTADAAAETLVALTEAAAKQGWRVAPGPIAVRTPGLTAEFTCEVAHD